MEKINLDDLTEITEEEKLELEELLDSFNEEIDDAGAETAPSSRIEARKWVHAYLHADKEKKYLKDEYIPFLMEKYIAPVKDKMERLSKAQDFIKDNCLDFLESAEETKINFPDLATISIVTSKEKIVYPEDKDVEESMAEQLFKDGKSNFVKTSHKFDKKAISEYYKDHEELPFSGLGIEETDKTVRVTKAKKKKEKK